MPDRPFLTMDGARKGRKATPEVSSKPESLGARGAKSISFIGTVQYSVHSVQDQKIPLIDHLLRVGSFFFNPLSRREEKQSKTKQPV